MNLTVKTETSSTITLTWTPQTGALYYLFFAAGQLVSNSPAVVKGTPKTEIRYSKTNPGPPFEVAAITRTGDVLAFDRGVYPQATPPPTDPWTGWLHEVSLTNPPLPNRYFTYTGDSVTLNCFGDMPVMGPGTSFPRHLVSSYLQNGKAKAVEGAEVTYRTTVTFPAGFQATTGEQNWLVEWHTANSQLSNAIGLRTDFPVSFTQPGANPTWFFRPTGPAGAPPVAECIGPPVTFGRSYDLAVTIRWSTSNGRFRVALDGTQVFDKTLPTLWPGDQPGFGLYHYRLAVPFDSSVTFTRPVF